MGCLWFFPSRFGGGRPPRGAPPTSHVEGRIRGEPRPAQFSEGPTNRRTLESLEGRLADRERAQRADGAESFSLRFYGLRQPPRSHMKLDHLTPQADALNLRLGDPAAAAIEDQDGILRRGQAWAGTLHSGAL